MLHSVFATSCPGCFFRWPFSSALAFAPVRFKSCSCLYSSRCLRTCAHPSTSPAALTDRSEIASTLSLSLGFKPCLYSSRPRPRSFASSWTLQHFSPALHPQRSPRCPQCPISIASHYSMLHCSLPMCRFILRRQAPSTLPSQYHTDLHCFVVFVCLSEPYRSDFVVPTRFRDLCALIENRVWVDWGKHRSLPQLTKNSKRLVRC